jgi:predicted membrane channel-forming protein YqfA (hemolysin III family)
MRSVLSVLYVTGVIFAMPAIAHLLVVNKLAGLFQVVLWIVSGCALYMAHTPESNSWIDGNAVPSKSYDTFL